jgi:hypothetical protein
MTVEQQKQISTLLNEIARTLDVTKAEYNAITTSYQAVGKHLAESPSMLKAYRPQIRPQGSFLLGTAVRPVAEDGDLDIDLVCELTRKPSSWTQYNTKQAVGDRLKESATYREMLDKEGKRCWTLKYADGKYHMDILPCFVNEDYPTALEKMLASSDSEITDTTAIRITDQTLRNYYNETDTNKWVKSNPFGLAKWFYNIAYRPSSFNRSIMLNEAIAPVPKYYETKSTLQRVIQLLKRHRDITFINNGDDKPISMIITVLAAKAYDDSIDLFSALKNIVFNMTTYIDGTPGHRMVKNPVNPEENFAERWTSDNKKEENFYRWVTKLQQDVNRMISVAGTGLDQMQKVFESIFGESVSRSSFKTYGNKMLEERKNGRLTVTATAATLGTSAGTAVAKHNFYGKDA